MPHRPSRQDLLASRTTLDRRIAFEEEVCSTPLGRRSWALRQKALELIHRGQEESAFKLYEQAASLHAEGDRSPAAAMCWYDLAESYTRRRVGVRLANLAAAEGFYRRGLASPAVERDPHRAAKVRNGLASCLRHIAKEQLGEPRETQLLDEAARLFEEAVSIARQGGVIEWQAVASYLHNWANLEAQRERWNDAILRMDQAEEYARRITIPEEPRSGDDVLSRILVHAAQKRLRRDANGDRERAIAQLREAVEIAHPGWIDRARLALAAALLGAGPARRDEALVELRGVRAARLTSEGLRELADVYQRAGLRQEALRVLHRLVQDAMGEWHEAMATHSAYMRVSEAQEAAHLAARLYIEEGDVLEAFITLEYTSGTRFSEASDMYCLRPASAVGRALKDRHASTGALAVELETLSDQLALVPDEHRRKYVQFVRASLREARADAEARGFDLGGMTCNTDAVMAELDRAAQRSDPAGYLRRRAEQVKAEAVRIERRLIEIAPEANPYRRPWVYRLTADLLRDLLREHRDHALIRLSLTADLLVLAVWLEGDELVARSHRVRVPEHLHSRLALHQRDPEQAPAQDIAADLLALDLSPALPPQPMAHAVVLPSFMASFLPLAAIGPAGGTLLDRFDAVTCMPCLTPLFDRQSPHPPRAGLLTVAPGQTCHHGIALDVALPGERQLTDAAATVDRVLEAAREADVVCFYTHGCHEGELGPEIQLHDGALDRSRLDARWIGMERVELWACQSGVNLPYDFLTPPVDETFGLDNELLNVGVRSAIGTLWRVPDLVTACLVHRYRRGLLEGRAAPRALADAQRWWRDEGVRALGQRLRCMPPREALRDFAQQLGLGTTIDEAHVDALLGPAPAGGRSEEKVERVLARLANPLSWAGFRFVGVAERRPSAPWTADHGRLLTPAEREEVERLLSERPDEAGAEPLSYDDWQEKQHAEATSLERGARPTPDQAIRVARLYRDRVVSSHRLNLLCGLAWLHEAIASLEQTTKGAKQQKLARQRLSLEAAWLWIDVARGEALNGMELALVRPPPVAVVRARRMLEGAPDSVHARAARAWVDFLDAGDGGVPTADGFEAALRCAWEQLAPVIRGEVPDGYEGLRTLAAVCELALIAPTLLPDAVEVCLARARPRVESPKWKPGLAACGFRLRSAVALLSRRARERIALPLAGPGLLTPRELAREAFTAALEHERAEVHEAASSEQHVHRCFDALEGNLWGYCDDDRSSLWRSSGTLGSAYRRLSGLVLESYVRRAPSEELATQLIAMLNFASDLRLVALSRWVRLFEPAPGSPLAGLWEYVRDREMLLEHLDQAAVFPDLKRIHSSPPRVQPHNLDPFRCSSEEIVRRSAGGIDLLPWSLADLTAHRDAKTAAFGAASNAEELTRAVEDLWRTFREHEETMRASGAPLPDVPIAQAIDPGIRLDDGELLLRRLPPGTVVLGMALGPEGRLIAAAVWSADGRTQQRVHLADAEAGWQVRYLLAEMHVLAAAEATPARGAAGERRERWGALQERLGPVLNDVLEPALDGGARRVAVLAPGALRPLPLLGVVVGGRPLFERAAVLHLPSLGFARVREEGSRDACLLGRQRAAGDTSFGESAIETLRRWFEPRILRPPREVTTMIVEVDQLEPIARTLRSLRLYGAGSAVTTSPALACLTLEGQRHFSENSTRGLFLPRCEVEIWGATSGSGPVEAILRDDRDQIPGLARSFLLSGAVGALDLAWPVPDLVKALVCERFGVARRAEGMTGPAALAAALAWSAETLQQWRGAASGAWGPGDALRWLDEARRAAARDAGLRSESVVAFAARADAPSLAGLSVPEILDEACCPAHLAAFRWWGWLEG
ncbi:CHAT domain-containing protein [Sorangium sp. So ce1335]|uniref:CHAT domain-containing protein n=1 Tax=Sorangium sp. So ce1335 TaxID=3133335 RepID=UPI003F608645